MTKNEKETLQNLENGLWKDFKMNQDLWGEKHRYTLTSRARWAVAFDLLKSFNIPAKKVGE